MSLCRDPLSIGNAKNGTLRRLKTILYWNEFYGRYDTYDFGYGHEAFVEKRCGVADCFATKVLLLLLHRTDILTITVTPFRVTLRPL